MAAVAEAFPGFPTLGIEVAGPLHLKTLLGQIGDDTLCVSSETGDSMTMYKVREKKSTHMGCHDKINHVE